MGVNCVFLLWGSVNLLVNLCSTLIPVLFLCCSYHENETKHIYSLREAHWHIYMCVFNEQTRSILDLHGNTKCSVTLYLLASSVFRVGYPGYHQLSAVCVHLYVGTFWCRKESPVSSRAIVSLYVRFPSEIKHLTRISHSRWLGALKESPVAMESCLTLAWCLSLPSPAPVSPLVSLETSGRRSRLFWACCTCPTHEDTPCSGVEGFPPEAGCICSE